jgi:DNA-binding MarR family transcriptional regulator
MKRPTRSAEAAKAKDGRRTKLGILDGLLGYHLRRAQLAVFQHFAATVGAAGITPAQLGVLCVINANPGLSQTRLGTALGIDRSTVVGMIDQLEGQGLVRRTPSPNDRRSHALQLSEPGATALRRFEAAVRAHENAVASRLGPADRRRLIALLRRIAPPQG